MSTNSGKMSAFTPALGLIFGGAAALILAILTDWNMAITMIFGAGLGLVIGSMVYGFTKKQ